MYTEFEEINAYVYHSGQGMIYDGLIWCLGPYVDDTRDYGVLRLYLANYTRRAVRRWYRIEN